MIKHVMKIAAAGALIAGVSATAASANGSVFPATAQTGETVGLAMGAPLPEGVYFVNTLSWGSRNNAVGENTHFLVEIPVIAWSTPWSIFGANFQLLGALPMAHVSPTGAQDGGDIEGLYNPFAAAKIAYDLGGGFGVSYLSGFYFNAGDRNVAINATTWRQDFAISYTGDGWNLTANLLWGITFDSDKRCRLTGIAGNQCNGKTANGFNLDLTATKTFGKWEIGAVGFGSRTYDEPNNGPRYKQFALGPLVGYNFGPVILQAYLTRDIYARNTTGTGNRRGKETRFWTRAIIPLWTPDAPAAPLVTKY